MKHLNRPLPAPSCLNKYKNGRNKWEELSTNKDHSDEVWEALHAMQGNVCAYCESPISPMQENGNPRNGHIEHFRRKHSAHFPSLTFEWSNLFGSCQSDRHCGHYRDRDKAPPYNSVDLIKPDVDDPESYLTFDWEGRITPLPNLSPENLNRASETIRALGLDEVSLTAIRRDEFARYKQTAEQLSLDLEESLEDQELYALVSEGIQQELNAIKGLPYETAIRHTLQSLLPI